jgi:hypothetical protein
LLKQKVVAIILGYFIFSKNHKEPPKVAQLAKIAQSGHPDGNQAWPIGKGFNLHKQLVINIVLGL